MDAERILTRLRVFLLGFSAFMFAGTLLELVLINHTKETIQWVPFGLCVAGILAVGAAYFRPGRKIYLALRAGMSVIALGSLIGVWEHIESNLAFALEVHPDLTILQRAIAGLSGAAPLMAPGMLALAAILAVAATYAHPALRVESRPWKAERSLIRPERS